MKVIIIGAGAQGRVIEDIIRLRGDDLAGFLDDCPPASDSDKKYLGCVQDASLYAHEASFIIGVGDNKARRKIAESLPDLQYYTAIHPSAVIAQDAVIGAGTVVLANAVVGVNAKIGAHCIINTAATVDHDNVLENYVHVSPGVHTAGFVHIGEAAWLGVGSLVSNNVSICAGCILGAGTVAVKDITIEGKYVGVPARPVQSTNH